MIFCWFMSWSGSVQVYKVYKGFLRIFLLENPQSENLTHHPWSFFFCPASKKTCCFQLFHFLKFTDYLLKLNNSLELNIRIGKLRMPVTCFWICWLKWDTIPVPNQTLFLTYFWYIFKTVLIVFKNFIKKQVPNSIFYGVLICF